MFRSDSSFLAYPTGISMSPTGARKCRLTLGVSDDSRA